MLICDRATDRIFDACKKGSTVGVKKAEREHGRFYTKEAKKPNKLEPKPPASKKMKKEGQNQGSDSDEVKEDVAAMEALKGLNNDALNDQEREKAEAKADADVKKRMHALRYLSAPWFLCAAGRRYKFTRNVYFLHTFILPSFYPQIILPSFYLSLLFLKLQFTLTLPSKLVTFSLPSCIH